MAADVRIGTSTTATFAGYVTFFLPAGVLLSFLSLYLHGKGMSTAEVGFIVSCLFSVKLVASPLIVLFADARDRHAGVSTVFLALSLLAAAGLGYLTGFTSLALATVALAVSRNYFQSMLENRAVKLRSGGRPQYGALRLTGSLAVAIGVAIAGAVQAWRPQAFPAAFAGLLVASSLGFAAASQAMPVPPNSGAIASTTFDPRAAASGRARAIILVLLAAALLVGAHGALYSVGSIALEKHGFGPAAIAVIWVGTFAAEAIGFGLLNRATNSLGPRVIAFAASVAILRWGLMAVLSSPAWFAATFLLQAVTLAWCHGTLVKTISDLFPGRFAATGQALYLAGAHGIGMSLCTYFGAKLFVVYADQAFLLPLMMTLGGLAAWYSSAAAIRKLEKANACALPTT
ncbi:MFS transporter [Cupriavidus alkaliphilus]|uniref:Major facilitator superfamily associated domain-containing protein n=1 Tax=Cupriavidus alkaliphilus TaxID=942866 RepID=A0A7W4V5J5_9BURK|nr:MFS transporter [Cupriavidus alkaliphilus]MBB3005462.1 hypothetical protein [Cupriavidus alkaliphilus]